MLRTYRLRLVWEWIDGLRNRPVLWVGFLQRCQPREASYIPHSGPHLFKENPGPSCLPQVWRIPVPSWLHGVGLANAAVASVTALGKNENLSCQYCNKTKTHSSCSIRISESENISHFLAPKNYFHVLLKLCFFLAIQAPNLIRNSYICNVDLFPWL